MYIIFIQKFEVPLFVFFTAADMWKEKARTLKALEA